MCEVFGIEFTEHTAFVICAVMAVISAVSMISGEIIMQYADDKWKPNLGLVGCYMGIIGGIGLIVFGMLGGAFRDAQ